MAVQQASFYCPRCNQPKLFTAQTFNHTPHILASVFLCGLWLPIWALLAAGHTPVFHCSDCGFSDSVKYLNSPNLRAREAEARALREPFQIKLWITNPANKWKIATGFAGIFLLLILTAFLGGENQPAANISRAVSAPMPEKPSTAAILLGVKNRAAANNRNLTYEDYLELTKIPPSAVEYNEARKLIKLFGEQNKRKKAN